MTTPLLASRERALLYLLALTQFTIIMDFMIMMPLGPQIMGAFAITPAKFATAVSVYSWCAGLSGLLAATYIDRFDRRRLMLTIYALFAVSNLLCALASSFALLLLARAFAGLTAGVLGAVVLAIVSDVVPATRRGAAMGTIMMAFSLASVAGVPVGILLGAHFGWYSPFLLLVALSLVIWLAGARLIPSLRDHLAHTPPPLAAILPDLWHVLSDKAHVLAFALTFVAMVSQMMVIPFISPVLVANHGVAPAQLSWLYMAGGAATFFTSRYIGKLTDRHGKHTMYRTMTVFGAFAMLAVTHLPNVSFFVMLPFFPLFMISMSGRMVPMQALMASVPDVRRRGAFLSANSAVQSIGTGCGAWFGGLLLSSGPGQRINGYESVGWLAIALSIFCFFWVSRVRSHTVPTAPAPAAPGV